MWDDLIYAVTNPKKSFKNFVGSTAIPTMIKAIDPFIAKTLELERASGAKSSSIPLELRAYWSSIINPETRKKPLTEAELFDEDRRNLYNYINRLESIRKAKLAKDPMAETNWSEKEKAFTAGYSGDFGYDKNVMPGSESFRNTLGAFNYTVQPDGTYLVQDVYDFRPIDTLKSGQEAYGEAMINRMLDVLKTGKIKDTIKDVLAIHGSTIAPNYDPSKARKTVIRLSPPKKK